MAPESAIRKRKLVLEEDHEFHNELQNGILDLELSEDSENDDDYEELDSTMSSEDDVEFSDDGADEGNQSDAVQATDSGEASNPVNVVNDIMKAALDNGVDDDEGPNYRVEKDAYGGERFVYDDINPVYDSDDSDFHQPTNTIGNIPISFYDSYPHIGYDINGKKIMRPAAGEALDALLDTIEVPEGWTGLTDPETGKPLNLNREELELLRKIQMNEITQEGFDPYPETIEWFTSVEEKMPLSAAPEPKRRFIPSKHEQKRIMKLVKAIRQGKILPYKPPEERERERLEKEEELFDIWQNEQPREQHIMHIPAPKLPPPGYDMSYNPPPEYLPSKKERQEWEKADPEDRQKEYLPTKFDALRKVPAYANLIKERFERCLDLYLAPRVRRNRLHMDPEALLPKLPKPEDLRPFPTLCQKIMRGHTGRVRSVAFDPLGEYIASGGEDGTVRVWDSSSGHELWRAKLCSENEVYAVRWRPDKETFILAAAVGDSIMFAIPQVEHPFEEASRQVLDKGFGYAKNTTQLRTADGARKDPPGKWERPGRKLESQGVLLMVSVRAEIRVLNWHRRGDYLCTVSPAGQRSAVAIHNLSKHLTNYPIRRLRGGIPQHANFHPTRPLFYVAMQRSIYCYDLLELKPGKKIRPGAQWISGFDMHPSGDHMAVSANDRRLVWHDLDNSTEPYKTMRFHSKAVRSVKFHRSRPLFLDCSDDGTMVVFHAKVVSDLNQDPVIVPVKTLKGHMVDDRLGVLDIDWHPTEAHCISAGADGTLRYWG